MGKTIVILASETVPFSFDYSSVLFLILIPLINISIKEGQSFWKKQTKIWLVGQGANPTMYVFSRAIDGCVPVGLWQWMRKEITLENLLTMTLKHFGIKNSKCLVVEAEWDLVVENLKFTSIVFYSKMEGKHIKATVWINCYSLRFCNFSM